MTRAGSAHSPRADRAISTARMVVLCGRFWRFGFVRPLRPYESRPKGAIWGAPADEPAGVPLCPRRRCSLTQNSQGLAMQVRLSPSCGQSPPVYRRAFPGVRRACAEMLEHLLCSARLAKEKVTARRHSRRTGKRRMEQGRGIEPPSPAWKAGVLAVVLPLRMVLAAGLEPAPCRLQIGCTSVCASPAYCPAPPGVVHFLFSAVLK